MKAFELPSMRLTQNDNYKNRSRSAIPYIIFLMRKKWYIISNQMYLKDHKCVCCYLLLYTVHKLHLLICQIISLLNQQEKV